MGLKRLVSAILQNGTRAFAQFSHTGAAAKPEVTGAKAWSQYSTSAECRGYRDGSEGNDADRPCDKNICRCSNADPKGGVRWSGDPFCSAHGYLLNRFSSPLTNKRQDKYTGETLEGRMRLQLEIIWAIRNETGQDYPLAIRLSACDHMPGRITIHDSVNAARAFEMAGIDLPDISGGFCIYKIRSRLNRIIPVHFWMQSKRSSMCLSY